MKEKLDKIMKIMETIDYGFTLYGKDIYPKNDDEWNNDFSKKYHLQSPSELLEKKKGVCWDQVELERFLFEKEGIECQTFFIVEYDGAEFPTHTFAITTDKEKYYWFEHSWEINRGIKEFNTLTDTLKYIKSKFINMLKNRNLSTEEIVIYRYDKPEYGISSNDFFQHCENGEIIDIGE